jgi:hypothetical protein
VRGGDDMPVSPREGKRGPSRESDPRQFEPRRSAPQKDQQRAQRRSDAGPADPVREQVLARLLERRQSAQAWEHQQERLRQAGLARRAKARASGEDTWAPDLTERLSSVSAAPRSRRPRTELETGVDLPVVRNRQQGQDPIVIPKRESDLDRPPVRVREKVPDPIVIPKRESDLDRPPVRAREKVPDPIVIPKRESDLERRPSPRPVEEAESDERRAQLQAQKLEDAQRSRMLARIAQARAERLREIRQEQAALERRLERSARGRDRERC